MPSELEGVELDQRLEAEDRVVADADVVDVVARLFEVGGERRPVEDGHAADVDEVVLAFGQLLWPTTGWPVDGSMAGAPVSGSTTGCCRSSNVIVCGRRRSWALRGGWW